MDYVPTDAELSHASKQPTWVHEYAITTVLDRPDSPSEMHEIEEMQWWKCFV